MPDKAKRFCKQPNCSQLVVSGYCEQHKKDYNKVKRNQNEWNSWYSSTRWRTVRSIFLSCNPLCVMCEKEGRLIPATVVDHREPHKGDYSKFWDMDNYQALCKRCHDVKTAKEGSFGK